MYYLLTESFKEQHTELVKIILDAVPADKIYFLGSTLMYRRTESIFMTDAPSCKCVGHYYVLVLIQNGQGLNVAQDKIENNCQHFIPVTAIVLRTDQFNQWVSEGHQFAKTVCKIAILLHGEKQSVPETINEEVNKGFSNLAKTDYRKIKELFFTIDSLNAHKHDAFQTLVFSDTILIFNKVEPLNIHDHEYLVMYFCEFVQDLIFRCKDLNIQFRAIVTYDEFYYEKLKNIEAYHGKALINAYQKEKEISGIWLFIDKRISEHNRIFASTIFDKELNFVYLLQSIERISSLGITEFPVPSILVDQDNLFYDFIQEVQILKTIKENIDQQSDSRIRSKYLQTYHLFKTRYKSLIEYLEENNFNHESISPNANWKEFKDSVEGG